MIYIAAVIIIFYLVVITLLSYVFLYQKIRLKQRAQQYAFFCDKNNHPQRYELPKLPNCQWLPQASYLTAEHIKSRRLPEKILTIPQLSIFPLEYRYYLTWLLQQPYHKVSKQHLNLLNKSNILRLYFFFLVIFSIFALIILRVTWQELIIIWGVFSIYYGYHFIKLGKQFYQLQQIVTPLHVSKNYPYQWRLFLMLLFSASLRSRKKNI